MGLCGGSGPGRVRFLPQWCCDGEFGDCGWAGCRSWCDGGVEVGRCVGDVFSDVGDWDIAVMGCGFVLVGVKLEGSGGGASVVVRVVGGCGWKCLLGVVVWGGCSRGVGWECECDLLWGYAFCSGVMCDMWRLGEIGVMCAIGMRGVGYMGRVLLAWALVSSFAVVSSPAGPVVAWITCIVTMAIYILIRFDYASV